MTRHGLYLLLTLLLTMQAGAHTVPSITLEAVFGADRSFEIRVNIDPRLVISDKPATLPPIEASWYREQTPEQLKATFARATEYLRHTVTLKFGGNAFTAPDPTFQPMDGSTSAPLTKDTTEVHLLATLHGKAPDGDFQVSLNNDANTSLILLNSFDGKLERRPQVIFASETSRPFGLPVQGEPEIHSTPTIKPTDPPADAPKNYTWAAWFILGVPALWALRRMTRNFRSA
jgi:hypothetical protein